MFFLVNKNKQMIYIFIFIIIIIISLFLDPKIGGTEKLEYIDMDFPIEKNIKLKSCDKPKVYLPRYCEKIDVYNGIELPDYPQEIKNSVYAENIRQEFSTNLIPYSAILGYFYIVAEVLAERKYNEIIILGSYPGVIPLVIAELFQCKIYYFTIKPVLRQLKDNKFVKIFNRFPNESDFKNFRGLPLFNLTLIIGIKKEINDAINAQHYTFAYANYILKSFQPIFSRTVLRGFRSSAHSSQFLPEGKIIIIPYVYYRGCYQALETEGALRDSIYDFNDIALRCFIFNHCARSLDYDHLRIEKIPDYKRIKKVTDKYIGKQVDLHAKTREKFLQNNSCYQKKFANDSGKFLVAIDSEDKFKYSYIDGLWYNMPKLKFVSNEYLQDIWSSVRIITFKKETIKIKGKNIEVNLYDKYKKIFVTGFYNLKHEYAYLISKKSEIYLSKFKIKHLNFYLLPELIKYTEASHRHFTPCKNKKKFLKIAAKEKQIIIEENFYRPELVDSCAHMMQTIWGNNPYPYRCFIPDSRLLRDSIAVGFPDAIIYVISDNPEFDGMRQTLRIRKIEDFIEEGDFLFTE